MYNAYKYINFFSSKPADPVTPYAMFLNFKKTISFGVHFKKCNT